MCITSPGGTPGLGEDIPTLLLCDAIKSHQYSLLTTGGTASGYMLRENLGKNKLQILMGCSSVGG